MSRNSGRMPIHKKVPAPPAEVPADAGHTSDQPLHLEIGMEQSKDSLLAVAAEMELEVPAGATKREILALIRGA